MKEFYVDKLPMYCEECKALVYLSSIGGQFCSLLEDKDEVIYTRNKLDNCPIKQLTNAQLAIGWYQEDKIVVSKEINITADKPHSLADNYEVGDLLAFEWEIQEPQYVLTDWEGARQAYNKGLKVTIDLMVSSGVGRTKHEVLTEFKLCKLDGYYHVQRKGECNLQNLQDKHFDSTEWKVWEK